MKETPQEQFEYVKDMVKHFVHRRLTEAGIDDDTEAVRVQAVLDRCQAEIHEVIGKDAPFKFIFECPHPGKVWLDIKYLCGHEH